MAIVWTFCQISLSLWGHLFSIT